MSKRTTRSSAAQNAPQTRKRKKSVSVAEDVNELPHNLGKVRVRSDANGDEKPSPAKKGKVAAKAKANIGKPRKPLEEPIAATATAQSDIKSEPSDDTIKPAPMRKAKSYGLTPGQSPFPDWKFPTPEQCYEINEELSKVHGKVVAPDVVPPPSATVAGCGEVPSVLDALIRTLLSAATSGRNSSRAFQGLVDTFGLLQEGVGKGSVDWDKVRNASKKEVFDAIKSGGLADVKSKHIKEILDMVYINNQERLASLRDLKQGKVENGPSGAEDETDAEKRREVVLAEQNILSLDRLHALDDGDAFDELIKYPGIGPKTASCVLCFCLQRPSFAVDTHVFRLCKWLGWVPPVATRNSTYSHCEVRIPNELKYPLHQLFIRHGKTCPRCRAITGESSEGWEKGCPIEHLVVRTGSKKGGLDDTKVKSPTKTNGAEATPEINGTPKKGRKAKARTAKKRSKTGKGSRKRTAEASDEEDSPSDDLSGEDDDDYRG
ncbi:MAG: hypothetical protein M1825_002617 [Sarcosagium campestre]|nr:MAG: hypothetical protein M1825_002617 [Sarcosagium campestre]